MLFWVMPRGIPLPLYLKGLRHMDDETAVAAVKRISKGLCTASFGLNAPGGTNHRDVKADNIVIEMTTFDEKCEPPSEFDNKGKLQPIHIPNGQAIAIIKHIDFGTASYDLPRRDPGLTTPEDNGLPQNLMSGSLFSGPSNDTVGMFWPLVVASNRGLFPFRTPLGKKVVCPGDLFVDIRDSIDFVGSSFSKEEQVQFETRMATSMYRELVFFDTKDKAHLKETQRVCNKLIGFENKLRDHPVFNEHVKLFSLRKGSETRRIRDCPAFKPGHLVPTFQMMMRPSCRRSLIEMPRAAW